MSGLILDASVALAWHFEDETTRADAIGDRALEEDVFVPFHWMAEVFNGLLMGERRGRTHAPEISDFVQTLVSFGPLVDSAANDTMKNAILPLARKHDLTIYDAVYLELASRLNLPLATLNRKLGGAAKTAGLEILPS